MATDPPREPEAPDTPGGAGAVSEQDGSSRSAAPELSAEELLDRWRRALADLDNLRKRCAREMVQARQAERAETAAAWLPVVDNLELALTHGGADPGSIMEGVRAIHDQAVGVLAGLGYPRHEETGVPFDPLWHEAVGVVDDPGTAPGTVVRVVRPGYGDVRQLLRPMAAEVSKGQE